MTENSETNGSPEQALGTIDDSAAALSSERDMQKMEGELKQY